MQTGQVSLLSFAAIAVGAIGCVVAGKLSRSRGSAWVARRFLIGSGCCCLLHPLMFLAPFPVYAVFMLAWGFLVIGDSAQFSALTALTAPREHVGTALTAVTCVGFSITIASIQLLSFLSERLSAGWLPLVLIVGPLFGVLAVRHFETESITNKHKAV